jgi:DNA-binding winged helix-turn-helix (wHTH) protein/TolB-like protein
MERARFGTFEFSPSTGELRRDGVRVRLQAQPARVLAALVTRPGQLVTRETLQREIWGEGTHVDFERGLNFCIAQVRAALRDSAETPRFIETVPKQGYRFIASLTTEPAEPSSTPGLPPAESPDSFVSQPARGIGSSLARAAAALMILAVVAVVGKSIATRAGSSVPTIAVIPFYNETGTPELDPLARSIGDATVARLATPERTRVLSVIGNATSLKNPFARQDVQHIARELGAEWVLIGQLKTDGDGLRVIAHLIRVADMKHLWAQTFDSEKFTLDVQTRTAEAIAASVDGQLSSQ